MVRALVVAVVSLGLAAVLFGWNPEVLASTYCREITGQQVCIETIKRSAKYLWEYRVVVSIGGDRQPLKRYDCRQPTEVGQAAAIAPDTLSEAAVQQFICGLVPHR